jgi:ABC-2 type transport system permease protein
VTTTGESAVSASAPSSSPAQPPPLPPRQTLSAELAKLSAFVRRDVLTLLSYRYPFVGDVVSLLFQSVMFYFVGQLVSRNAMPSIGGHRPDYLAFVSVGIAVAAFMEVGLGRMLQSVQSERMIGTLESLLVTPTRLWTIQLGPAMYDLVYVPIRTGLFLTIVSVLYGVRLNLSGIAPAAAILVAFIPFVWGLGILGAANILTFRRGNTVIGFFTTVLSIGSGAYFPLELLPGWAETIAKANPVAIALSGMRATLLADAGWDQVWWRAGVLIPMSAVMVALGAIAFKRAVARERRLGTIGLY